VFLKVGRVRVVSSRLLQLRRCVERGWFLFLFLVQPAAGVRWS